jgi:hypothetical protein
MPDPETLARMIAALGMLAVGALVVSAVGWILRL